MQTDELSKVTSIELVRLLPEQLSAEWDSFVREAVQEGLPPDTALDDDALRSAYNKLVDGVCHAFVLSGETGEKPLALGLALLARVSEPITNDRALLVWSIRGYEKMALEHWVMVGASVKKLARSLGCERILFETANPRVMQIASVLGGKQRSVLMEIPT